VRGTGGSGISKLPDRQIRGFVYLTQPDDVYRAGRTLRSLRAAGIAAEQIGVPACQDIRAILRDGGPVLFLRAGAWLARHGALELPLPSATGKGLCALGALRVPRESEPGTARAAASCAELFARKSGDFARLTEPHTSPSTSPHLLSSVFLDSIALEALRERGASSLEEILRIALQQLRVVHYAPLDVYDDRGLRVLQVITALHRGGAERMTLDLMAELPACNVRARLAILGRPSREAFAAPAGTLDLAGAASDPEARAAALARLAIAFGADLVHGHLITGGDVRRIAAAGLPVMLTVHNTRPGWPKGLADLEASDAILLAACAQAVETELRAAKIPVVVRTAWNGIDQYDFQPSPGRLAAGARWRQTWGFGESDFVLAAVANPRPQKRLPLLPAVLAALRAKLSPGREVRLILAGEALRGNPEAERCVEETRAAVARLGVEAHVRWTGPVANVAEVLAAADALVSASAHEGLSMAQLEALAMGCPVVATDVGGAREIAFNNPAFHLLPADASAAQFAEVLAQVAAAGQRGAASNSPDREPSRLAGATTAPERPSFPSTSTSSSVLRAGTARGPIQNVTQISGRRSSGVSLLHPTWSRQQMAARYRWLYPRAIAAAGRRHKGKGIWLITNNFSTGGAQSSARRLLVGLNAQGVRVRATVIEEQPDYPTPGRRALAEADIPILALPPSGTGDITAAVETLLGTMNDDLPQSVLFWNLRPAFKVLLADALLDVPVFDVSPGEMFFESLDSYFAITHAGLPYRTARDYGARLAGVIVKYQGEAHRAAEVLGAPVQVVPNGVPLPEAAPDDSGRQNGTVFGTAARINPRKRLEDLLEAMRLANGRMPAYTLKIAGGVEVGCEEYAARLRALSDGLPVEWVGEVNDLRAFHRQLDAFVMVSEPAGCPNASLEAMSAGLPVIATDMGGVSEQVIDGRTGRLVPGRDPHALAAAMAELAASPGLRQQMGRAGRDLIRDRFSLERMIADYRRICLEDGL
jgi:glycosyltransferase involved in cell wall biosynthesis